jgi:hypothetical protein
MAHRSRYRAVLSIVLATAGLLLTAPARADLMFQVQVDTSAITTQSGYFDLQFNPTTVGALGATATMTSFATDGTFLSNPNNGTDGDVSGSLASALVINNTTSLNDLLQAIQFGTNMSFNLDISGPATMMPDPNGYGSAFGLTLYDTNFNPLLTTDPNGTVATILLNSDTTTSIETFPAGPGLGPAAMVQFSGNTVPEPSTIVIAGLAAAVLGIYEGIRALRGSKHTRNSAPFPGEKDKHHCGRTHCGAAEAQPGAAPSLWGGGRNC